MGLWYPKDSGFELIAYLDADHARCKDDCKSTSGGLQFLGGKLVSRNSKKQDCTAMSTAEAEYVSLSACYAQIIWMRTQLIDYGYKYNRILMYYDSKSAIAISCNPVQHSKTKQIDIRYHFIKEHVEKVIIMAQQQHAADVHPDELCPPNKRYDLMDANKKVDLEHVQCPSESKILTKILMNIITNHPLRFSIATSHLTIFHLPQANDNNNASFVPPPSFSDMVPFYKQVLGFITELKTVSNFKIPGLLQPWQTLCKIFSKRARDAYHNLQDDDIMKNIFNSGRNKNKVGMRIPAWMITEEMKLTEHYKMYAEVFGLDVPLTQSQPTESTQGTHRTLSAPRQSARLTPPVPVPTAEKADEMILQDMIQVSLAEHKSREEQEARENVALVYEHLAAEEIEKLVEESENVDDSSPPRHDDTSIPGTRLEPRSDKESLEVEIVQEKEEETTKDTEVEPDKDTPMVDVTNIVIPVNVDDEEDEITDEVFELRRRAKGKNVEESRISPIPSPTRSPRNLSTLVSSDTKKLQELTVTHPTPSSGSFAPKFMPRTSSDQLADNLHDVMMETLPSLVKEKVTEQVKKEVLAQVRDQVPVYLAEGLILERKTTKEETERLISKAILQERGFSSRADPLLQQQDIAIWLALQMKFEKTQVPQTACRFSAARTRDWDDPHDDAHPEGENSAKVQRHQI
ncbi:hypothetical protein Tco_0912848 [Tanacetum coccineum]